MISQHNQLQNAVCNFLIHSLKLSAIHQGLFCHLGNTGT